MASDSYCEDKTHLGVGQPKWNCLSCQGFGVRNTLPNVPSPPPQPLEPFQKFDSGKTQWHLLPWGVLDGVARVFAHGAQKYGPWNWRSCPDSSRYFDATLRHLIAHSEGRLRDEETSLPSLHHALASLLIYTALESVRFVARKED